jgi:hypothetical protein
LTVIAASALKGAAIPTVLKRREASVAKILDRFPDLKRNILREEWAKAFKESR